MSQIRFPSIKAVAKRIQEINSLVDNECEIRLQVYDNSAWVIKLDDHFCSSSYDLDHLDYLGISSIPGRNKKCNSQAIAKDLIAQVKENYYSSHIILAEDSCK